MITKGYVIEKINKNKCNVRLPIFEKSGISTMCVMEATICYEPGNINDYQINDCVYIGFEDNNTSKPIVLGKLFLGNEKLPTNKANMHSLKVRYNAELPPNTKIGDITFDKVLNSLQFNDNLKNILNSLCVIKSRDENKSLTTLTLEYDKYHLLTSQDSDLTILVNDLGTNLVPEYKLKIITLSSVVITFPEDIKFYTQDSGISITSNKITLQQSKIYEFTLQDKVCHIYCVG